MASSLSPKSHSVRTDEFRIQQNTHKTRVHIVCERRKTFYFEANVVRGFYACECVQCWCCCVYAFIFVYFVLSYRTANRLIAPLVKTLSSIVDERPKDEERRPNMPKSKQITSEKKKEKNYSRKSLINDFGRRATPLTVCVESRAAESLQNLLEYALTYTTYRLLL